MKTFSESILSSKFKTLTESMFDKDVITKSTDLRSVISLFGINNDNGGEGWGDYIEPSIVGSLKPDVNDLSTCNDMDYAVYFGRGCAISDKVQNYFNAFITTILNLPVDKYVTIKNKVIRLDDRRITDILEKTFKRFLSSSPNPHTKINVRSFTSKTWFKRPMIDVFVVEISISDKRSEYAAVPRSLASVCFEFALNREFKDYKVGY